MVMYGKDLIGFHERDSLGGFKTTLNRRYYTDGVIRPAVINLHAHLNNFLNI